MPLTRDFMETINARARRDVAFRAAFLAEAIDSMLEGDVETGKIVLRDYINATVGFEGLGAATRKSPKSLMRMLGAEGNPQARNCSRSCRISRRRRACASAREPAPSECPRQPSAPMADLDAGEQDGERRRRHPAGGDRRMTAGPG